MGIGEGGQGPLSRQRMLDTRKRDSSSYPTRVPRTMGNDVVDHEEGEERPKALQEDEVPPV